MIAAEFGTAFVTTLGDLLTHKPDVVVEAASHEAVRLYCGALLDVGVSVIVLSAGALSDDKLRARLEASAIKNGAPVLRRPFGVQLRKIGYLPASGASTIWNCCVLTFSSPPQSSAR